MKNCCCGQEVVDFQVPRGGVWLNINSEPLSLAPQQMRDKSRNDCWSLVLAWKCVCQTPPLCAGTVSKGISPKGGAFSPPYGMSPTCWPASLWWRPCWTESMFRTLWLPLKFSHPFCYARKCGLEVATVCGESPGLSCFLSELCDPIRLGKFSPRGGHLPSVLAGKEAQGREVIFWGPCRDSQQIPIWYFFPQLLSPPTDICFYPCLYGASKGQKDRRGVCVFDHWWHIWPSPALLTPGVLTSFTHVSLHLWSNPKWLGFRYHASAHWLTDIVTFTGLVLPMPALVLYPPPADAQRSSSLQCADPVVSVV